jgi:hypothetical protein
LKPCSAKSPAVYRQLSEGPPKWQNPKDQQDPWAKETKPSTDYAHGNIPSSASSTESAEVCRKVEERTGHSLVFSDRFISLCIGGGFRSGLQTGPGILWINFKLIDSVFAASGFKKRPKHDLSMDGCTHASVNGFLQSASINGC